jgi:putative toxin-antitoxin system antitoxin component (TIGR02293 family)
MIRLIDIAKWQLYNSLMTITQHNSSKKKETTFQGKVSRILGSNEMTIHSSIKEGFPFSIYEAVVDEIGIPQKELSNILGIPARTMARRKESSQLTIIESDRLYRIIRVVNFTLAVFDDSSKARAWLKNPNRALNGETPISLLSTEAGTNQVEEVLQRIKYGIFG